MLLGLYDYFPNSQGHENNHDSDSHAQQGITERTSSTFLSMFFSPHAYDLQYSSFLWKQHKFRGYWSIVLLLATLISDTACCHFNVRTGSNRAFAAYDRFGGFDIDTLDTVRVIV
jgi:hypothetical protein